MQGCILNQLPNQLSPLVKSVFLAVCGRMSMFRLNLSGYSENSFNQGATMRALNIANLTHPESTSKNPRVLRENSVTFLLSTCIPHLDNVENKGSVVSVAPVLVITCCV